MSTYSRHHISISIIQPIQRIKRCLTMMYQVVLKHMDNNLYTYNRVPRLN